MRRLLAAIPVSIGLLLLLAPLAFAEDQVEPVSGEGSYGPADDKVVTNAGFLIIIAVPLFVLLMSLLQGALDRRKERRKLAAKKLSTGASEWKSGW